ncbi:MAG: hypothetical protein V1824_01875 [archaeon]
MVSLITKKVNGKNIYYLHHAIRTKKGFSSIDKYIGSKLPTNIEEIKLKFFSEVYFKELKEINKIKDKYTSIEKKIPFSIKQD